MTPQVGDPVGYCDPWSVAPGESVNVMVSTARPAFHASLVRLTGQASTVDVPSPIDGRYPGRVQVARPGSCVVVADATPVSALESVSVGVWAWPTRPVVGREQVLVSGGSWLLGLDEVGRPFFRVGTAGGDCEAAGSASVTERAWVLLCGSYDAETGTVRLAVHEQGLFARADEVASSARSPGPLAIGGLAVFLGAEGPAEPGVASWGRSHYDGKLDAPTIYDRALSVAEVAAVAAAKDDSRWPVGGLVAAWRFQHELAGDRVLDVGPSGLHGRVVNAPTRAVTGHGWSARRHDPAVVPDEYGAIHLHADDLDDSGWEVDLALRVPDELPSGVYAVRLTTDGGEDLVPFVVRPPRGAPASRIALVLPTFTYLAYANELLPDPDTYQSYRFPEPPTPTPWDAWLNEHPEIQLSLYDMHADGSGVCYSSRLRPIPSLRPAFITSALGFPRHLAADLMIVEWLAAEGFEVDVLTDDDLDADPATLDGYRVVLTGSHPEYVSQAMLDAFEAFVGDGGRLMYLGGNGFCWVTSRSPDGRMIEVRRGQTNQLPWDSCAGELHHSTTGELGGQWELRGRGARRLVGVNISAMGLTAQAYQRTEAARDPRYSWVFDGLADDQPIGGEGMVLGAAGGYEIDSADVTLGSPASTVVLATAAGDEKDYELVTPGSTFTGKPPVGTPPSARADMVLLETASGGAVFSVGSIAWGGSLQVNGGDNPVATVTRNVLTRFLG